MPFEPSGRVLGGSYRIVRRLDQGGMGTIYVAEHLRLPRRVAVKILARHLCESPEALERFRREAAIISGLDDPHIVSVLDFDVTDEGFPYLVMELLHGETLANHLERQCPLELDEVLEITAQVASGLAAAHAAGIVHRDLKPANIFLVSGQDTPFVKLLDFGISKRTTSSQRLTLNRQLLGTPQYMAPEQAAGRANAVGPGADQFALAGIVYEMLTGEHPFAAEVVTQVLLRVLTFEPRSASEVAPWVPPGVDAVLSRALSKKDRHRFANVRQFSDALLDALGRQRRSSAQPRRLEADHADANRQRLKAAATEFACEIGDVPPSSVAHRLIEAVDAARAAFLRDDIREAVRHAQHALTLAHAQPDPMTKRVVNVSERLFEKIFLTRLGSEQHYVRLLKPVVSARAALSPKEAFLLSRIEAGARVDEILDVAAMPRLEALAELASLVEQSVISTARGVAH